VTHVYRRLPGMLRFVLAAAAFNLLLFAALRLAFWFAFRSQSAHASTEEVLFGLYIGFKFDLRLALLLSLPPLVLGSLRWLNPVRRPGMLRLWLGYYVLLQIAVLFIYAIDFGNYAYLHTRLNSGLLEHLFPLSIAAQMAWETYPVIPGVLGLAAAGAASWVILKRIARFEFQRSLETAGSRWPRRVLLGAVLSIYALGVYGKWSWFPLRWSDAYFSTDSFVSALALNPVLYLSDSFGDQSRRYDLRRVRDNYDFVAERLEVTRRDPEKLSFAREVVPHAQPGAPMNLVVIHLESFAAFKVGAFGNPVNATPNFDALAREGTLFTDFFVPAAPSARSVFTMITGIPDYDSRLESASRNPRLVEQNTVVNALRGYDRFYFLGGSAAWANIRGLLAHNIPGLQIYEEGNYGNASRVDTWGVPDLPMLEKANEVFKAQNKPFFAFIQTSGNHRPFTIPTRPEELRGFKPVSLDDVQVRAAGFDDLAAYNGLRYFDHALGNFFRLARAEPYYRNTLFVMYGDHGNPSASDIPYERIGLTGSHVPMLMVAPGKVQKGRVIDSVASEVDILPTSLGVMGVPYVNTGFGRDLLKPRPASLQFALFPEGVLDNEYELKEAPGRNLLYRYRSADPTRNVAAEEPQKLAELTRLREALYDTARYLVYHNPPRNGPLKPETAQKAAAR
jgi:phosphoglycerol transferase MdoB-like AlkP superfamily enzyme